VADDVVMNALVGAVASSGSATTVGKAAVAAALVGAVAAGLQRASR
jgi:hypothetical protein